jgi:hypothetical protein
MLWRDRLIGVVLGLLLGLGVIVVFVFVYSEQTVDAPSLHQRERRPGNERNGGGGREQPSVATVRVVGGAPPPGGPAELDYRKGDLVRLRVISDADVGLELLGYGIDRTVSAGVPTPITFKATKPGSFPLVAAASSIDVARITVGATSP